MSIANTCALLSDGTVSCWGSGVCSDDSTTCYTPTPVPGLNDAVQISLDGELWAVHRTGTVTCWKRWRDATAIPGLAGVVEVASGASHNCARLADGTVRCWGSNVYGALGEGTTDTGEGAAQPTTYRTEPGHVAGLSDVAQISAFSETTCAVTKQGQVACWGKNERGRLGNGEWGGEQSRPVVIDGITTAVEVDVGAHACARLRDGTMRCWGWNAWGMLGDGTDVDSATRPVVVRGLSGVKQIAVGSTSTCARTDRGTYCWGFNNYGQLGDGTTQDRPAPTLVRF
jgi:alpha-tubulin suppressor-like RCC1 family protein